MEHAFFGLLYVFVVGVCGCVCVVDDRFNMKGIYWIEMEGERRRQTCEERGHPNRERDESRGE